MAGATGGCARSPGASSGRWPRATSRRRVRALSPGLLFRSVDRLLRAAGPDAEAVLAAVESSADAVSGRVLLGLREHLLNRGDPNPARIFVNRDARAWVTEDLRAPLDRVVVRRVDAVLDQALARRLPRYPRLVVDPAVLSLALPLSARSTPGGFGVMPRGSVVPVTGDRLRFFVYWRQAEHRTDFDLSALHRSHRVEEHLAVLLADRSPPAPADAAPSTRGIG